MDIIFDIDGTLADCSHRLHYIQGPKKDWDAFFAGTMDDTPIAPTVLVAQSLEQSLNNIIFCTGRSDSNRDMTREWLVKHVGEWTLDCRLYMRGINDFRQDYIVKEEMLEWMKLYYNSNPVIAFEDRKQVVDMWRRNGLICYHVAEGNY